MNLFRFLFSQKKSNSPDVLGVYPEYVQVKALPERRYMKTARFLAVIMIINIALITVIGAFFVYVADRIDISIANRRAVNLYTIDSSRKVILPAEYEEKAILATELYIESLLRDYIKNRQEIVWDNTVMQQRWEAGGPVAIMSNPQAVYSPFRVEADLIFTESRTKGFVRDVHLYELKRVRGNVWEGVFDTFDMPIPDAFNPLCPCTDNSKTCIECKIKNAYTHQRFRVVIRINRLAKVSSANPFGYYVQSYSTLYVPIHEKETYWGIPSDLKPDL